MTVQFIDNKDVLEARLQNIVDKQIGRNGVSELMLSVSTGNDDSAIHVSGGEASLGIGNGLNENTPYFVASTAKLFATAILLQLIDEGKLALEEPIVKFFPEKSLAGLHVLKGVDRTLEITVEQLMSHTSGIADYFDGKQPDGSKFSDTLMNNQDSSWTVVDIVNKVRSDMTPNFRPGAPGKAKYSDTNFQLLGAIIEEVTQQSLVDNVNNRIIEPLQLNSTYLFTSDSVNSRTPVLPLRFKNDQLTIPMAMESVRFDGGIVSSSSDSMKFIQAFMQGTLFDAAHVPKLQQWKSIGFPLQAGVGILRFRLPRIMTLFAKPQELIGHSGISGAFAFYSPVSNVYIAGTVNQLKDQTLPFKFMLKVLQSAKTRQPALP